MLVPTKLECKSGRYIEQKRLNERTFTSLDVTKRHKSELFSDMIVPFNAARVTKGMGHLGGVKAALLRLEPEGL